MHNPNFTETQINKQLAKRPLNLSVLWDGDETAETPNFTVILGEDATPYFVEDNDDTFDVVKGHAEGWRHYSNVAWASGYHDLADRLVEIIKEDIDAGELSLPDEED